MEKIAILQLAVDSNMSENAVKQCGISVKNSKEVDLLNLRLHAARYRAAEETNRQRAEAFEDKAAKMEAGK